MHRTTVLTMASGLIASGLAAAQATQEDPQSAESTRVVSRDGTEEIGPLTFRWTLYSCGPTQEEPRGPRGGDPGEEESTPPPSGGRGGGGAPGGMLAMLQDLIKGENPRQLHQIERIESDGRVVFQAFEIPFTSPFIQDTEFRGSYGQLAMDLPAGGAWTWVAAGPDGAIAVRRDAQRDIVGRVRLWVLVEGDGEGERELGDAADSDERVFRAEDLERYVDAGSTEQADLVLANGAEVHRRQRFGQERSTGKALHLEANAFRRGAILPVCEILARGDGFAAVLEEARGILETVRFAEGGAVPPREQAEPAAGPGSGGRGAVQFLKDLPPAAEGPFLKEGRYVHAAAKLEMRAPPPRGWMFVKADEHGFLLVRPPEGTGAPEVGAIALTILDGLVDAKPDGPEWILERYAAGFAGRVSEKLLKPRKTTYGRAKALQLLFQEEGRGMPPARLHAVIEGKERTFVVAGIALGAGTRAEKILEEGGDWLESIQLGR